MADTAIEMPILVNTVAEKKKSKKSRKALKPKNTNEANILAQKISQITNSPLPVLEDDVLGKENQSSLLSTKKTKAISSKTRSFEKELLELQVKLEKMRLEKEKTDDLLRERDDMLKQKEKELETRGKEQEKLQLELKKLQKLKEFNPIVMIPAVQSLREKEQDKKEKEKKKNKTKKPSPAYVLWCKDQWNKIKEENPNAEFKEISIHLGAKWKSLSAEEKKPYEEQYQADKEVYLQIVGKEKREVEAMKLLEEEQKQKTAMELLEQYIQFKQEAEKDGKKKKKKERDPLKPKKPMSAFFLYSKERRAVLLEQTKNILEIAKLAGEEWKEMNEAQRKPYEEIAKKEKEEYLQEMEVYKQKKEEEAASLQLEEEEHIKIQKQEALQLLKKKEKAENLIKKTKATRQKKKQQKGEQKKDPNKPKRPMSSFLLFSQETRKNLVQERLELDNSQLIALISVKWKELDATEKKIWNDKAEEKGEGRRRWRRLGFTCQPPSQARAQEGPDCIPGHQGGMQSNCT